MRKPDVDLAALRDLVSRVYGRRPVDIARTSTGTTTQVYRLRTEVGTHYLRVAEDRSDRYGVEADVHERLLRMGVQVPEIVHYEPFDPALDRSVLITNEITGLPVADASGTSNPQAISRALREAGRDLAAINTIPVAGFGFMQRTEPFPVHLSADFETAMAFIENDLDADLAVLGADLPVMVMDALRSAVFTWSDRLYIQPGRLAHGDFDVTHIFVNERRYAGIIDFGEIRGADSLYDLGHFAIIANGDFPPRLLEPLLEGYREVRPLSDEDVGRMWLWGAVIGVRFLARTRDRTTPAQRARLADRIAHAQQRCVR